MLVAVCDQLLGTSTSSWRKMVTPFSLPISAVRFSHSTASNGEIFPSVKKRSNTNPLWLPRVSGIPASTDFPIGAVFTVAILFLPNPGPRGNPLILLLCGCRGHVRSNLVQNSLIRSSVEAAWLRTILQHEKSEAIVASANENDLPSAVEFNRAS